MSALSRSGVSPLSHNCLDLIFRLPASSSVAGCHLARQTCWRTPPAQCASSCSLHLHQSQLEKVRGPARLLSPRRRPLAAAAASASPAAAADAPPLVPCRRGLPRPQDRRPAADQCVSHTAWRPPAGLGPRFGGSGPGARRPVHLGALGRCAAGGRRRKHRESCPNRLRFGTCEPCLIPRRSPPVLASAYAPVLFERCGLSQAGHGRLWLCHMGVGPRGNSI